VARRRQQPLDGILLVLRRICSPGLRLAVALSTSRRSSLSQRRRPSLLPPLGDGLVALSSSRPATGGSLLPSRGSGSRRIFPSSLSLSDGTPVRS
jgi:hypothetical protein